MSALTDFRAEKDAYFAHHEHSPLTPDQRAEFDGLQYFEENPSLAFLLPVEILSDGEMIEILLSTGETTQYRRWGRVNFTVDGRPGTLTVFKSTDEGDLFLPFRDTTSASGETYGAGRYLEPEVTAAGLLAVDFNYAYNPYCAYNDNWACPLTPTENVLDVPVRAGEKAPSSSH